MRSVLNIMETRNELKSSVDKINNKLREIENGRNFTELDQEEQKLAGQLYSLMCHYKDQVTALSFVLNEDNKIDDYRWHPILNQFKEFLINP